MYLVIGNQQYLTLEFLLLDFVPYKFLLHSGRFLDVHQTLDIHSAREEQNKWALSS
jgi:hypothetical protein